MIKIDILGVKTSKITIPILHKKIIEYIEKGIKSLILNVNIHAVNIAQRDHKFRGILNSSPIVFCDGYGVKMGAWILNKSIPEVISYGEWIWDLSELCSRRNYKLFILGGYPGDSEKVANRLKSKYNTLNVVGTHHGFFDKSGMESNSIIEKINENSPDILLCSFGMPMQEKWLNKNYKNINAKVFLAGGGCVDLLSKRVPSPPSWLLNTGFRWLFRFTYEPKRVFKRYIFGNPLFVFNIIKQRIREGKNG